MPKIQLTNVGMDKFNGRIGEHKFTNGVSDEEMSSLDAQRFGAVMRCKIVGTEKSPGPAQRLLDSRANLAPVVTASPLDNEAARYVAPSIEDPAPMNVPAEEVATAIQDDDEDDLEDDLDIDLDDLMDNDEGEILIDPSTAEVPSEDASEAVDAGPYTREDLEKIADEGGMPKLREFAAKHNVRGVSIKVMIDELMAKQTR